MNRRPPWARLSALCLTLATLPAFGQVQSLDGPWSLAVDSGGTFSAEELSDVKNWRPISVPGSWQAQCADLRDYQGVAWYKRTFQMPSLRDAETAVVRFGAVDYAAEVFVNGHRVGAHEGGYAPFECDIRGAAVAGTNEIVVRVMDPRLDSSGTEGVRYAEIPHGKQSWYVQTSGLWQSVTLGIVPKRRIERLHLTPGRGGTVACEARLTASGTARDRDTLTVVLLDPDGRECCRQSTSVDPRAGEARLELTVAGPRRWSIDRPNLYTARATLTGGPARVERFGFRTIETAGGRILLNGTPVFMTGALDQDFYPEHIYTTPSKEYLLDEMRKARRIGLNTLRCHIKVPDEQYLDAADEVGILVWYEIPNWDELTPDARRRARNTFDAMLERDWNHPSLVIISLINESWGIDLQKADQRAWLKEEYTRAKKAAAGRLVVDNSACWGNFHVATDINDYHTYWAIPENMARFDQTVANFAQRPSWLFGPFGDGQESGTEPLVMSEFGNWGLPDPPEPHPWWLGRAFYDNTIVHPKGFQERFRAHGYREVFGDYANLSRESQQAQAEALKYEIESLRLAPALQGYVITEFTDINWESNGVLDMWRNVKRCGETLADVQQQDMVIPRPLKRNVWSDESPEIELWLSHYGDGDLTGGRLVWSTPEGSRGSLNLPSCRTSSVTPLGRVTLPPAGVRQPMKLRVNLEVRAAAGNLVARNHCDLFVYPRLAPAGAAGVRWHDPAGMLASARAALSGAFAPADSPGTSAGVTLTNVLDAEVRTVLSRGGAVVCCVDSQTVLPQDFPVTVIRRDTGGYDGNWASNLNWVRPGNGAVGWIPSAPRLGFESGATGLPWALGGVPAEAFGDVLAGLFVGWLHNNAGYVVQLSAGGGILVLCTIPIMPHAATDPFAATMLHRLAEYASGGGVRPRLTWELR